MHLGVDGNESKVLSDFWTLLSFLNIVFFLVINILFNLNNQYTIGLQLKYIFVLLDWQPVEITLILLKKKTVLQNFFFDFSKCFSRLRHLVSLNSQNNPIQNTSSGQIAFKMAKSAMFYCIVSCNLFLHYNIQWYVLYDVIAGSIHQQAQQQQQMENLRFNSNPYQNNSPVHQSAYPQSPVQHVQSPLANPYVNQAARTNNLGMSPQFHRSHTWHGNELSSAPQQSERDRDRDMRGGRDSRGHENRDNYDRNRDRGHHHRDRSGGRYRGEPMEDHRNSPASDNFYGGNGFEARRQKVLDKHNRMLQGHRGGSRNDPGRKGHY